MIMYLVYKERLISLAVKLLSTEQAAMIDISLLLGDNSKNSEKFVALILRLVMHFHRFLVLLG